MPEAGCVKTCHLNKSGRWNLLRGIECSSIVAVLLATRVTQGKIPSIATITMWWWFIKVHLTLRHTQSKNQLEVSNTLIAVSRSKNRGIKNHCFDMSWPIHGKNSPFSNDFQVLTSHTAIPYDAVLWRTSKSRFQSSKWLQWPNMDIITCGFFKSHVLLQVRNGKMSTTLSATTLETAFLQDGWFIHVRGSEPSL